MKYIKKNLSIEKVKIKDIVKKFSTPVYCYSYKQLKENISNFKKSFKSFSPLICFAIKSNTNINIIREIRKFGLGADVVSMGELMMAIKAGIDPESLTSPDQVLNVLENINNQMVKNARVISADSAEGKTITDKDCCTHVCT